MINKNPYASDFNLTRHRETSYAAEKILAILLSAFKIKNAIDIGCGVGTFLSILERKGLTDFLGLDGNWVDRDLLAIPADKFMPVDLKAMPKLNRTYDLLICLEVAEHLPSEYAATFIGKLCELSKIILFSAAIPRQKGASHLNEAWQSYWAKLFTDNGYFPLDLVRPKIWNDSAIPFWYRQNALVYVKQVELSPAPVKKSFPLDVVHPELYLSKINQPVKISRFKKLLKKL